MEELLYKLCGKVLPKHSFRPDMLLPFQLEVGFKGRAEPVVRAVEKALEGSLPNQWSQLVSLGFTNASNSVDRKDLALRFKTFLPVYTGLGSGSTGSQPSW